MQDQNAPSEGTSSKQNHAHAHKKRAASDAALLGNVTHSLSNDHPAMSMVKHLDTFGPLLFPLYRAALLRKRILILTHPPVKEACNLGMCVYCPVDLVADFQLVYNISVISSIPSRLADAIPKTDFLSPIRPLFNVGIHDITYLASFSNDEKTADGEPQNGQGSYIACSTDDILATKHNIYDVVVELPQNAGSNEGAKRWPELRTNKGELIKSTQRDLRRYRALRKELHRIGFSRKSLYHDEDEEEEDVDDSETAPLTKASGTVWDDEDEYLSLDGETKLVEPTSWTAMAYTGFLWWASAGENNAGVEEEDSQDSALLVDLPLPEDIDPASNTAARTGKGKNGGPGKGLSFADHQGDDAKTEAQAAAMLLIAFAHRLTTMTMESMADVVESANEAEGDGAEQTAVSIESEDLRRMGLDVWSQGDKQFAQELLELYFNRRAEVRGQGVECCGMRIC